jgi:hypothetical protein
MAAIVKANSTLANGGLAVLKRSFSTEREGKLTYSAEYVCLPQFARNHAAKFITGSFPPTALPAIISDMQIRERPTLYDLQTETINGLTYFRATYSAAGSSEQSLTVTTSSEQRSFSASLRRRITTGPSGFRTTNIINDSISFEYISNSVTVSSVNRSVTAQKGSVGARFNVIINTDFANVGVSYIPSIPTLATTVESSSRSKNSDGSFTNSITSSGIYVLGTTSSNLSVASSL